MMGDVFGRNVKITKLKRKKYWGRDGVMMMILIRETLLYRQKITMNKCSEGLGVRLSTLYKEREGERWKKKKIIKLKRNCSFYAIIIRFMDQILLYNRGRLSRAT